MSAIESAVVNTTPDDVMLAPPVPVNSLWPVYLSIVIVSIAVLAAVVIISARGNSESTPIIVSVIGFGAALMVQLFNSIKTQQVSNQVQAIHVDVNSRMTQMAKTIAAQNLAEGKTIGASEQREQTARDVLDVAAAKALLEKQMVELEALRANIASTLSSLPVSSHIAEPEKA